MARQSVQRVWVDRVLESGRRDKYDTVTQCSRVVHVTSAILHHTHAQSCLKKDIFSLRPCVSSFQRKRDERMYQRLECSKVLSLAASHRLISPTSLSLPASLPSLRISFSLCVLCEGKKE
mmetsp:Transcript_12280/g.17832  ORF Transcript_12280/g.17832 Transcript_12280/m.17832 type:complete len:120 (-) Transcript_12280:104-463(-)